MRQSCSEELAEYFLKHCPRVVQCWVSSSARWCCQGIPLACHYHPPPLRALFPAGYVPTDGNTANGSKAREGLQLSLLLDVLLACLQGLRTEGSAQGGAG
eukprot:3638-Rhodomonas_salina.1